MRRLLLLWSLCWSLLPWAQAIAASAPEGQARWLTVEIGIIGVASVDILRSALQKAEQDQYSGLVIILDTPGGALDATRDMVKDITSAKVPLVVWVGPSGAHAGSAGAFLTVAAPIAAMAPGTNIGAAHPIQGNGQNIPSDGDLRDKIENDTIAFMDSIARLRGRNSEMAVSFVATSLAITAEEALENKVIDLVSPSVGQVLDAIDGRTIVTEDKQTLPVHSKNALQVPFEKNLRARFLEILSNPNLFYLLFIIGLLGLGFEITHPGVAVPGVVGALSLVLALISSSVLPINFGAIVLVIASIGFMVAELFVPSFGILGVGGFLGFLFGSLLLIDSKNQLGLGISWFTIGPSALAIVAFCLWLSFVVMRNQKAKARTGKAALIGRTAEALEDFAEGQGQVRIDGEIWSAQCTSEASPICKGQSLEILAVEGLTLKVAQRVLTRS